VPLPVARATSCPNAVFHPWLKRELADVLAGLPTAPPAARQAREERERWQEGLRVKPTLPAELPPLRALLVLDDLAGHKTPELVPWLFRHGIMPLRAPVSGSWLNRAESIQRVLKRRALEGQHPTAPAQVIGWLEAAARRWNAAPTPFKWGGKRKLRRKRQRERWHRLGGSGALTGRPVARTAKRSNGHTQGD
jgi:hypothetical protein